MKSTLLQMVGHIGMIDKDLERYVTSKVQSNGFPEMTRVRFAILKNIQTTGKPNQKMIATMTGITPQAIYRHIKFLEERKYISRKNDIKDGRLQSITITKKGEKLLHGSYIIAKKAMSDYCKNLNQKEIQIIHKLLNKIKPLPEDFKKF